MENNDRSRARQLVVVGYCIVAIGYFIQFVDYFTKIGLHNLFGYELLLYYLCTPLAYGVTGWSWYWLSRETPSEGHNTTSRRRGLRGLALQSVVISIGTLAIANEFRTLPGETAVVIGWLLVAIGGSVVAIGFWLFTIRPRSFHPRTTPIGIQIQNSDEGST
jgi:hypothetical protein